MALQSAKKEAMGVVSLTEDGRRIVCDGSGVDGSGCRATACPPVALLPALSLPGERQSAEGWLFVANREGWRHYCPLCAAKSLAGLSVGTT